jgi:hypothetical protein
MARGRQTDDKLRYERTKIVNLNSGFLHWLVIFLSRCLECALLSLMGSELGMRVALSGLVAGRRGRPIRWGLP